MLAQVPGLDPPLPKEELAAPLDRGSPILAGHERELRWLRTCWREARSGQTRVAILSGPTGIGKTRLAGELTAEVERDGSAVLYVGGRETSEDALATIDRAREAGRPTLLVFDNADEMRALLLERAATSSAHPNATAARPCAAPRRVGAGGLRGDARDRLRSAPRTAAAPRRSGDGDRRALRAVEGAQVPPDQLVAASGGVPASVHRVASEWARTDLAGRLEETADRAAGERGDLRTAEAQLAGEIAELQTAGERAGLYLVGPVDPEAPPVCPFRGLVPFDSAHAE